MAPYEEKRTHERHKVMPDVVKDIVRAWLAPAGFLIIFGAVVWGIQLNLGVLRLIQESAKTNAAVQANNNKIEEDRAAKIQITIIQNKLTLILERLEQRVDQTELRLREHNTEAEIWKRKIERNEAAMSRKNGN